MTVRTRFLAKVAPRGSGCQEWTGATDPCGYGRFNIAGTNRQAHRVSYELHNGPIPAGMEVLHTCDNPPCVSPSHLRLGTHAENMADMARKGRADSKVGARNGRAKLTASDVEAVRDSAEPAAEIAAAYGLHWATVYKIRAGKLWPKPQEHSL